MEQTETINTNRMPTWLLGVLPLLALVAMVAVFALANPLAFFNDAFPPLEDLTIQRVLFPAAGEIELQVVNGGPDPVTIAQTLVDDAYWQFTIEPGHTLERGVTFGEEVEVAVLSPTGGGPTIAAYALLGIYVGVVPVLLGMMWYPFMRQIGRRWVNAILALTVGLLVFLFVDTVLEALEIAELLPGVYQGVPLVIFGIFLTVGVLMAVGQRRGPSTPLSVATLIALGIGLHNFGEGLAIGAAFAAGAAALASFLVIGFTLHNITEGVGIAAPLTKAERPKLITFVLLALLAGAPAILGTWIGGLAFSPFLAVLFLSVGAGAILQVIYEVGKMLWRDAERQGMPAVSWVNFAALTAGVLIMYVTAFLVKF
jgi:zinc transporter ZupT